MSTHPLDDYQGALPTTMGQCFPGQRTVFRGHDLHATLHHDDYSLDWMALYAFGICGRHFSAPELTVLHALWTCTSYPDARLWNNRVAALAGSARSTATLAIAAGIAASEATIFGWQPVMGVADFLIRARGAIARGASVPEMVAQELIQHKHIGGYGRPVATLQADERIAHMLALMDQHGVERGAHLALAFAVEDELVARGRALRMNYAPMLAAIPLDFGFTLEQLHLFITPSLMAGMPPCYLEARQRPAGATFALRCERLSYHGPAPRVWLESR
ncbi:MAG: citryl-CoA lyase [Pseudomonadota bacterium]